VARLEELERKFEENPRRYFAPLANEYRKAGDSAKAAELCRSQLPEVPGHISGHIVLGQSLFDSGDLAGARTALETALALDPENIVALRYLGDIARNTGDTAEAERWYARTLEADPYNEAATQGLQALREAPSATADIEAPVESAAEDSGVSVEPVSAEEAAEAEAPVPADAEPVVPEPSTSESVDDAPVEDAPISAEFAGDLAISAESESAEESTGEPASPPAIPLERFDVEAHEPIEASVETDESIEPPVVPAAAGASAAAAPEAAASDDALQAEERVLETAAPFVTETMADLYLEQGYPHEALELLMQLAEQRPDDERLREKVAEIESVIAARRDAAVAAARAERAEIAQAADSAPPIAEAETAEATGQGVWEPAPDAPFDAAVAEVDSSAFAEQQNQQEASPFEIPPFLPAEEEAPTSVRELFARMDRARPRPPSSVTPRPLSRLRSDFAPMPDPGEAAGAAGDDPFAFPDAPRPDQRVARTSGPQPTFNPSTADIDDFEAWLRGLKGP
jgi:tetratricopeptide (TPR) repeat protein